MSEVCFEIEGKRLYVDEELVEFDIPIFFICKDEKNDKYAVLCIDSKKQVYIIVKSDIGSVLQMLASQITLRDFFLNTCERWKVRAGDEYWLDDVEKIEIFQEDELPVAGTHFELENTKIKEYVKKLYEERVLLRNEEK